MRETGDAN